MTAPARVLTASEPWVEYQLDDGTLLRFRWTACNFRPTGKVLDSGDPEYSFSQQLQCETHAPKQVAKLFKLPSGEAMDYVAPAEDCG